ncbi:MAG: Radical SAM domain protein [Caldanaerobacter subterraneus]|nr:MAG: Radical SAM domain protein [Caldanaerobacter subterraneus]HAA81440.1 B12-binding domain-containing radical SAM protein [Thermoanaerobacter sp.]HCD09311.1 B12-binding domain-containing radical SAM protein [Thermoanaerobacter sp.]
MKTLLVGINAKYYHTNLAIRNIRKFCHPYDIEIFETTINDSTDFMLESVVEKEPDVVGISCYIWNIEIALNLAENIKKILPKVILVLGGPEASYDVDNLLSKGFIDYIVLGEGEIAFKELLEALEGKRDIKEVAGISYKVDGQIVIQPQKDYVNLNEVPISYEEEEDLSNKLVYYETSRGCPFKCAYCLSSIDNKLRYESLEKVEGDLKWFVDKNVKILKLIDRSFNSNRKRAREILNIMKKIGGDTVFHCEVNPELVDKEFIEELKGLEKRIQFEVGVQTTNKNSLKKISRITAVEKALRGIKLLREAGIKLHVDLIAGLPEDSFETFSKAFDDVYNLKPDEIQLGFLKVLKGTPLMRKVEEFKIVYDNKPPYEILYTKDVSYQELVILKGIAFLLNKYYNSGKFKKTLEYLENKFERPFDFYLEFYKYWKENELLYKNHSLKALYDILYKFSIETLDVDEDLIKDVIKFDFLYFNAAKDLPDCVKEKYEKGQEIFKKYIKDENWLKENLPQAVGLSSLELSKKIVYEFFKHDVTADFKKENLIIIFLHGEEQTYYAKLIL